MASAMFYSLVLPETLVSSKRQKFELQEIIKLTTHFKQVMSPEENRGEKKTNSKFHTKM